MVPCCFRCGKDFVNAIDSITNEMSEYIWKPDCDCLGDDLRICIG